MNKLVSAGGCFWGMEELFRSRVGVVRTRVGYSGGQNEQPSYEFHPGHAEAVELIYDPEQTTLDELLDYFYTIHDPTTLNRQGNDIGESYRSAIFYADASQLQAAQRAMKRAADKWQLPVTTTLEQLSKFWPAEDYHQNYLQKNPGGYTCHYERW